MSLKSDIESNLNTFFGTRSRRRSAPRKHRIFYKVRVHGSEWPVTKRKVYGDTLWTCNVDGDEYSSIKLTHLVADIHDDTGNAALVREREPLPATQS